MSGAVSATPAVIYRRHIQTAKEKKSENKQTNADCTIRYLKLAQRADSRALD